MRFLLFLLVLVLNLPAAHAAQVTLQLDGQAAPVDAWPAVTILPDAGNINDIAGRLEQFAPPDGPHATLGLRKTPVWLRLPLRASSAGAGRWILDIDYPALNRIEVFRTGNGLPQRIALLGNLQPWSQRPLASRSHSVPLELAAGESTELLIRVETSGGMVLPITLSRPAAFHAAALREQILQGLQSGLALCLLVYSLAQGLALREPLFAKYALLVGGSQWFCIFVFGIGAQYLWTDSRWVELHAGGLSALMAACGSFLFIEQALRTPDSPRWFTRLMQAGCALSLLFGLAYAADLLDTHAITAVVGSLGLLPALLGLPGAIRRQRRGDSVGGWFLLAWIAYFVFTAITVEVIKGRIGANAFTLHSFQIGATLDMLIFLRVLGLRTAALRSAAQQAARERDLLHAMAHTDALTGLANRRGLGAALADALARCTPQAMVGVFLLDLNGFKLVNDTHGHEVGDELLAAVARRLQARLQAGDLVARLGGDEFIVMCPGLREAAQAGELAARLQRTLDTPFDIGGRSLAVGAAIGFALAPRDGLDATTLLKRADEAMYRVKAAG
ncbi:diguanylate cyclase [Pelomonas sp. KK5]|uniref:diguanylate cyclase n=1 Tax=Pelomonas sp. KK5 TaxID=1855730 RepID=UPI0009F83160|nr:diguanylate cyclase [Pelomonas sp. KK5]